MSSLDVTYIDLDAPLPEVKYKTTSRNKKIREYKSIRRMIKRRKRFRGVMHKASVIKTLGWYVASVPILWERGKIIKFLESF